MLSRAVLPLWLATSTLLVAAQVQAQEINLGTTNFRLGGTGPGSFPLERLRPAQDHAGVLDVESGEIGAHLDFDVALWVGYQCNPLSFALRNDTSEVDVPIDECNGLRRIAPNVPNGQNRKGAFVRHRLGASLVGSLALFEWIRIGAEMPGVLFQWGDAEIPGVTANTSMAIAGIGDLRLSPKFRILRAREMFVDLAILTTVTIPTGLPWNSYMGEGFFTFVPEVALSRRLFGFKLAGNLGYRLRPLAELGPLEVGHELTYRGGVGFEVAEYLPEVPLTIDASLSGAVTTIPLPDSTAQLPLEGLLGASWTFFDSVTLFGAGGVGVIQGAGVPDWRVLGGIRWSWRDRDRDDDGINDDLDKCIDEPEDIDGDEDFDGCPEEDPEPEPKKEEPPRMEPPPPPPPPPPPQDRDDDGIIDPEDKCIDEPEDKDGFEDEDGCPDEDNDQDGVLDVNDGAPDDPEDKDGWEDEDGVPDPDNDGDGFLDADDKCPDEAEVINNHEDFDGCPDEGKTKIIIKKEKIEILEKVYFDTDSAKISSRSYALLDQVFAVLKTHAELTKVRIEGHTDTDGDPDYNVKLSQNRANSVMRYMVGAGIDPKRLEAVGYGETRPVAPNDTEAGKEKNRRVEFVIVEVSR